MYTISYFFQVDKETETRPLFYVYLKPFYGTGLFLCPLKISEKTGGILMFSRGMARNGLIMNVISVYFYLLKVKNRNTGKRCEICLKLTVKTPERRQ